MQNQNEIRTKITNSIIVALSSGQVPPWRKPWLTTIGNPMNIISGQRYRGINPLILSLHQEQHNFRSKYYATFNQWKQLGGFVKKRPDEIPSGEWGTNIVFYNIVSKTIENRYGIDEKKTFPILRSFTVFNLDQVEGRNLDQFRAESEMVMKTDFVDFEPVERFIKNLNADIRHGGNSAYYKPSDDRIQMPDKLSFESENAYYETLLHEVGHWSQTRVGWETENTGKLGYAENELFAEITGCFLCAELGVPNQDMKNHFSYIDNWIQLLSKNQKFIFKASAAASKAVDFLLQRNQEEETSTLA